LLGILARILKVLNSETAPAQIAAAVLLALFMGLSPLGAPHNLFLLLLVLVLRVNLSLFLVSFAFFSGVAWLLDPLAHSLGKGLLEAGALEGLWTAMYNTGFWRFLGFNNTVLLGQVVVALVLAAPVYFAVTFIVRNYREHLRERIQKSRLMLALKGNKWGSKFYSIYSSLNH
jgi:uncharacterized protein (TIGR03546 family)